METTHLAVFNRIGVPALDPSVNNKANRGDGKQVLVDPILCRFPFLCQGFILFHLMSQNIANHCYWFTNIHSKDIYREGCTCADKFKTTGFKFLHQGCIMFHVMWRLVENPCYQLHNKHSQDFQQIVNHKRSLPLDSVKLNYSLASTKFFIHTIGGIIQLLHPFATDFNNNGSTTISNSWLCAFSAGVWHDSFPCPKLLSAPVSSVVHSVVNSSTYASKAGGGMQPQITQLQIRQTQPQT